MQFCAFDVLAVGGEDLRALPLSTRKTDLERLLSARWIKVKNRQLLPDETVLVYHEQIREQVALDASANDKHCFMGLAARERANTLLDELRRRRFVVSPIDWPRLDDGEN